MNKTFEFKLNGQPRRVVTDPRRTLLDVLREDLHLTGTKYGCGEGQCRACTVLLDGKPVASCQTSIDETSARSVETIEGLAGDGPLHPVQEAFLKTDAMQCGYCVPGMILTIVGSLRKNPAAREEEIVDALNGNICRCCGYANILKAVRQIARAGRKEAAP